jgi:IMP cyclohydrolase
MSQSGQIVMGYGMTARSEGNLNRVILEEPETGRLHTEFAKPSEEPPGLVIYNAMQKDASGEYYYASNGDHTDVLLTSGETFATALEHVDHEPDGSKTPRIALQVNTTGGKDAWLVEMASIRAGRYGNGHERSLFEFSEFKPGTGVFLPTYANNAAQGKLIPSYRGAPFPVPLNGNITEVAHSFWDILNPGQRIALAVRFIDPAVPNSEATFVINERAYEPRA